MSNIQGLGGGQNQFGSNVLLSKNRPENTSPSILIAHEPIRFVAFGLTREVSVLIKRVWRPQTDLSRNAHGRLLTGGEVLEMPLRYGGRLVQLTAEQPEIVLDMVGEFAVQYVVRHAPDSIAIESELSPDAQDARANIQVVTIPETLFSPINDLARGIPYCCPELKATAEAPECPQPVIEVMCPYDNHFPADASYYGDPYDPSNDARFMEAVRKYGLPRTTSAYIGQHLSVEQAYPDPNVPQPDIPEEIMAKRKLGEPLEREDLAKHELYDSWRIVNIPPNTELNYGYCR